MQSSDLTIKKVKAKDLYHLRYQDINIVCFHSDEVVEHPNKELLEFIRDDLFKCGEFSLNSRNQIEHTKVNSAYILFSSLKSLQNEELYEEDVVINLEEEIYDFFNTPKNINSNDKKMHKKLESLAKNTIFRSLKKKPLTNIEIIHI